PVKSNTRRPKNARIRQGLRPILHGRAGLITERERIRLRIRESRLAKERDIHPESVCEGKVIADLPNVLPIEAKVVNFQRLKRLVEARNVRVANLEPCKRYRRGRSVGISEKIIRVRIEICQRIVNVSAL